MFDMFNMLYNKTNDVFAYELPADAPKYQLIVCLGLIAHTGRIEELLAHLKTMLANDGAILLQSSLDDHLGNRLVKALTARKYAERFGYSVRYFRHRDIVRAAEATGLQVADRPAKSPDRPGNGRCTLKRAL